MRPNALLSLLLPKQYFTLWFFVVHISNDQNLWLVQTLTTANMVIIS